VKRWLLLSGAMLASAIAVAALALFLVHASLDEPLTIANEEMTFVIEPGASFTAISNTLAAQGVISRPQGLRLYASLTGIAGSIQAGEYRLKQGMTARDMMDAFLVGDVQLHSFTIVEGWNLREMLAAMAGNTAIRMTISTEDLMRFLSEIGSPYAHPEGLFLPETYHFPRGTRDTEVLRQAYDLMQATLNEEWTRRDPAVPLSDTYEALILASIVEKETARVDERARIAGVFVRRLKQHMRLQTDPTVIYGIGDKFDGNLTRADLQTDTPYNTYTRGGLPPTPIAMPGREAIKAVLHPEPGNDLYFVATGLGDGSHKFSETVEQHEAAVRELLARQRANRQATKGR
jgi:UPF0755 protein